MNTIQAKIKIYSLCVLFIGCNQNTHPISETGDSKFNIKPDILNKWKEDSTGCLGYRKSISNDSTVLYQFVGAQYTTFEYYFGNCDNKANNVHSYFVGCSKVPDYRGATNAESLKGLNNNAEQLLIITDSIGAIVRMHMAHP